MNIWSVACTSGRHLHSCQCQYAAADISDTKYAYMRFAAASLSIRKARSHATVECALH